MVVRGRPGRVKRRGRPTRGACRPRCLFTVGVPIAAPASSVARHTTDDVEAAVDVHRDVDGALGPVGVRAQRESPVDIATVDGFGPGRGGGGQSGGEQRVREDAEDVGITDFHAAIVETERLGSERLEATRVGREVARRSHSVDQSEAVGPRLVVEGQHRITILDPQQQVEVVIPRNDVFIAQCAEQGAVADAMPDFVPSEQLREVAQRPIDTVRRDIAHRRHTSGNA